MGPAEFILYVWLPFAFSTGPIVPEPKPADICVSPETTHIEAPPLTRDGRVDYVEYLNQQNSIGVSPERNSAVLYLRAIGRQEDMPESYCREIERLIGAKLFDETSPKLIDELAFATEKMATKKLASVQDFYDMESAAMDRPWQKEQIPLVAEWLKRNEPALKLVGQAGRLPQYFLPLPHARLMTETQMPYLQHCRVVIRLLNCRVMLRAQQGDYEGASRDLISMFQLASKTGQGRTLMQELSAAAFIAISNEVLEKFISAPGVGEELLRRLQSELAALAPVVDVSDLTETQRLTGLEMLQYAGAVDPRAFSNEFYIFRIRQEGWGAVRDSLQVLLYQWIVNSRTDWNVLMKKANAYFDMLAQVNSLPTYGERQAALKRLELQGQMMEYEANSLGLLSVSVWLPDTRVRQARRLIFSTILPKWTSSIDEAWCRAEVRRRTSPLGCAIERYRRVNGEYPPNLDALVPAFIDKLPADPYTNGTFHYRVNGDRSQYAVFTFGPNGNDDNGASFGEDEGLVTDDMGMHSPGWLAEAVKP